MSTVNASVELPKVDSEPNGPAAARRGREVRYRRTELGGALIRA
ncbi:hypothetical protein ACFWY9_03635 [Amycolatopsis sp. NPDC059027]